MTAGIDDILKLGDPRLYEVCDPIQRHELPEVKQWVQKLHEAMEDIRRIYGFGRGIAAPQLGIMKRLVYINIDRPLIIINPEIIQPSQQLFELWDDCMSFPNLLVKVQRHQSLTLKYLNYEWEECEISATDSLSELIQHEVDHLNGILCTMRAMNSKSFRYRVPTKLIDTEPGF